MTFVSIHMCFLLSHIESESYWPQYTSHTPSVLMLKGCLCFRLQQVTKELLTQLAKKYGNKMYAVLLSAKESLLSKLKTRYRYKLLDNLSASVLLQFVTVHAENYMVTCLCCGIRFQFVGDQFPVSHKSGVRASSAAVQGVRPIARVGRQTTE